MALWSEFKEFIGKSNVLGLAIAVVLGAAFGAVVASFTNDILMQLIAALGALPDFSDLSFSLRGTPIRYGAFLTTLLSFLIIAFTVFLVMKGANRLQRQAKEEEQPKESELDLLRQIRDRLEPRTPVRP